MYEIARNLIETQAFSHHLGIKIERLEQDKACLTLPYDAFLGEERVNGGAIASLIDLSATCAFWCHSDLSSKSRGATISLNINFMKLVRKSDIFAYPCSETLKISWICLEDVAAFMVAALSDKEVKADKITVGGPEILLGNEVAERFSNVLGRKITFQSLEPNTFARQMSKLVTGSEEYEKPSIYGGMAAFYRWYNEQNPSPLAIEMSDLYEKFSIKPTYFEDWIKKHDWDNI